MNKKTTWNPHIFRKNDIRGIYKKDFDLDFVPTLAEGFVRFCQQNQPKTLVVAVGYDARLSSPEIAFCLKEALKKAGADVCFLELVPSPLCFFASHFVKEISASIMVTASHNPPCFNGFKMVFQKETICDKKILKLQSFIQKGHFSTQRTEGKERSFDMESAYISFIKQRFLPFYKEGFKGFSTLNQDEKNKSHDLDLAHHSNKRSISIVVDCGNGASGPLAQKVYKALADKEDQVSVTSEEISQGVRLGTQSIVVKGGFLVRVHWLYAQPDGRFPHHHPDPSLEGNLQDLKQAVQKSQSSFGVAFDGDGDRLVVVGRHGQTLQGDELMSIFIADILKEDNSCATPEEKTSVPVVVVDVKCGDWFLDFLREKSVKTVLWKSGHSLIRQKTIAKKAVFGGELSGHFFFCDEGYPIDDGLYGLLRLIEISLRTGEGPEKLVAFKNTVETAENRYPIKDTVLAQEKLEKLKLFYKKEPKADVVLIDGVRVSFPKRAWGLARFSNTQREWTFRFGGENQEELNKIQADFYRILGISLGKNPYAVCIP